MSAKLTIIFFILICFEIGFLLVILPWLDRPSWSENFLLVWTVEKLHWPWLGAFLSSGFVKGAVTGLGLVNIWLGVWEFINFKKTVRAFERAWKGEEVDK
jgi:hypothetical protein